MSLLNVKYSLYHELKTVILPDFGYIEDIEGEELQEVSGEFNTYSFANDNIAYADASGHINPSGVKIYDDGTQLPLSDYSVNYVLNTVVVANTPSGPITSDYSRYTIEVIDAFPDSDVLEQADLPLIAVDIEDSQLSDYAIGQQASFWNASYFVDIFAITDPMRLQLMERIQRGLKKWIPLIDLESNMPLNYDGTINTDFDWSGQFIMWMKNKSLPYGDLINLRTDSPKEKYRATVSGIIRNIY